MKWWPTSCKKGDMIRARAGSIYHYGIFVREEEVIQFGPSPALQSWTPGKDLQVMATDIQAFCQGAIVEVAAPETAEERKRFSAAKTVKLARSRIGEGGYDLIHNNCEHFVYECAYGVRRCTQAEEVRRRWFSRSLLHVYILPMDKIPPLAPVYPPEREAEIKKASGVQQLRKYATWKALEQGLAHAFGKRMEELTFTKTADGKWSCAQYGISLSHTEGAVAVAVSSGPVGVDLENIPAFERKYKAHSPEAYSARVFTDRERELWPKPDLARFLALWTGKESIFKCSGEGLFRPGRIDTVQIPVQTRTFCLEVPYMLSVSARKPEDLCCYLLGGERPCRLETQILEK